MANSIDSKTLPGSGAPGRIQRWLSGDLTNGELAVVLLLPAIVLILSLVIYPVTRLLWLSVHEFVLTSPQNTPFVAFDNYLQMFADSHFWEALRVTAVYGAGSIILPAILGMILALVVNRTFRGRWIARVAVILPWAMPHSLSALTWSWLLDTSGGVVNDMLLRSGLVDGRIHWLGEPNLAMIALIVATTWKTASFVALILLAGLQSIPGEYYDSAAVDGAKPLQTFRYITLPVLRPHLLIALIFRSIVAIQLFDFPYALTKGGPGISTRPLSLYVYRVTLGHLDFGYGAALAIVMALIIIALTVTYMRVLRER